MEAAISVRNVSKTFGAVKALEEVTLDIKKNTIHALLGENGAGKSTIAKCIMGYYKADKGEILLYGNKTDISNPKEAHKAGIGMVYQHFMLVENMTVAENFIIARDEIPFVIEWKSEKQKLKEFLDSMPFKLPLDAMVYNLSAGEKQKLEILKMLYLRCEILILDEPTSVLTPSEADEVLGFIRSLVEAKILTVIIITHKFREVFGFADEVSVLRKGKFAGTGEVKNMTKSLIAEMMVGNKINERNIERIIYKDPIVKMQLIDLYDKDESGISIINKFSLVLKKGEIYGIAGVSGNGQKRLVEILGGQKAADSGMIFIDGQEYHAVRKQMKKFNVHCLPEEPLKNACIPDMSVADNMALRYFDQPPYEYKGIVKSKPILRNAELLIKQFNVKTPTPYTPIKSLSGGNVQRAVLARELSSTVEVLVISNPCFGLDFNAIADIRAIIVQARNNGTAVLLLSEDLDEIIELADRIGVIFNGSIIYETDATNANAKIIGEKMAGN